MPYLARSQENNPSILALHAVDSTGHLYDPATVEFRIMNLTSGSAVQLFPGSGYRAVTSEGRVDKGCYYATQADGVGWTPDVAADMGKYRIDWRFTDADDEVVTRTWSLPFDVEPVGTDIPYWTYLHPKHVRDEGVDEATLADDRLIDLIIRAQDLAERETRQVFRPLRHTIDWDGHGGSIFSAPMPILGIEYVLANHSTTALSTDAYAVHFAPHLGSDHGWRPKDTRRNPKIKLAREFTSSIYSSTSRAISPMRGARFAPGAKPHQIKGVWGYLEPDGTTPRLIREAMLTLVLATATPKDTNPGSATPGGLLRRERTDRHEIEYGVPSRQVALESILAVTPEVQEIFRKYRAPVGIASPATTWAGLRG